MNIKYTLFNIHQIKTEYLLKSSKNSQFGTVNLVETPLNITMAVIGKQ